MWFIWQGDRREDTIAAVPNPDEIQISDPSLHHVFKWHLLEQLPYKALRSLMGTCHDMKGLVNSEAAFWRALAQHCLSGHEGGALLPHADSSAIQRRLQLQLWAIQYMRSGGFPASTAYTAKSLLQNRGISVYKFVNLYLCKHVMLAQ